MKIGIDVIPLMMPKTGIGFYVYHLLSEFVRMAPENDYYLCDLLWGQSIYNMMQVKQDLSHQLDALQKISSFPFPFQPLTRIGHFFYNRTLGKAPKIEEMDLFFGPSYKGLFRKRLKTVITIHDMSHEYYPETINNNLLRYLRKELPQVAKRASSIITVSKHTKEDILKFLNVSEEKIKVIYNGVDKAFTPIKNPGILEITRERYHLPQKFLLYVGAIQPRKNIGGLIRAYKLLQAESDFDYPLVIAGGVGWKNQDVIPLIKELQLEDKVRFTGYIASPDLPNLYNLAEVFVFPSFYEGFGLPVLEAMACGLPVVTSNSSSLPEITGDAAILVDPHSSEDLANGVRRAIFDRELRNQCIQKGFERARLLTWEKCAIKTLKTFHEDEGG